MNLVSYTLITAAVFVLSLTLWTNWELAYFGTVYYTCPKGIAKWNVWKLTIQSMQMIEHFLRR